MRSLMTHAPAGPREFKSLALRLAPPSPALVYVFIKQHAPREGEASVPHTLFVTGLPLGLDRQALAAIFSLFGAVTEVALHPTKRSAAVAYAVAEGVAAALSHAGGGELVEYELPRQEGPLGLKAWVAAHKAKRPGNEQLQQQLDAWVEAHEAAEAAAAAARQAAMADDGWTVVVRAKGRKRAHEEGGRSTVSGGVAPAAAAAAAAAAASGKQAKQADNFYRFQQRDKRRSELMEVRQRFEEGRKRLAALKAARQFKPS